MKTCTYLQTFTNPNAPSTFPQGLSHTSSFTFCPGASSVVFTWPSLSMGHQSLTEVLSSNAHRHLPYRHLPRSSRMEDASKAVLCHGIVARWIPAPSGRLAICVVSVCHAFIHTQLSHHSSGLHKQSQVAMLTRARMLTVTRIALSHAHHYICTVKILCTSRRMIAGSMSVLTRGKRHRMLDIIHLLPSTSPNHLISPATSGG